jgi:regulation of enolase protein 1 (concanavalin A-like superfamily)
MKINWFRLLVMLVMMGSCAGRSGIEEKKATGEACSITFSGVNFTRSLNGASSVTALEEGKLTIRSEARRDYFNEPDGKLQTGTAPILLAEINNTGPFTFMTKVTPAFTDTYDAGALYIYLNPSLWFKFAFEQDERKNTRIVTVRTINTSDDNNHDVVTNESVYMKISSDTKTIGFYYSLDQHEWRLVRLFKNDYAPLVWLGLSAQSPVGNGTRVVFEACSLTNNSIKDFRTGI